MKWIVTGGAGFIGSCFVREAVANRYAKIINLDALTYAGNRDSLPAESAENVFVEGNINDVSLVRRLLETHRPDALVHFAAESHVDRSIDGPQAFIETNVNGTFTLLNAANSYWKSLSTDDKERFRFLHVSTDEVYGSLGQSGSFSESSRYQPSSPYAASKAAADHLVRAWHHTYGLPVLITNCSNNFGPYQFPEKLIPLMILRAVAGESLPVYGDGSNVRDWLHVSDHCAALRTVLSQGRIGETYNIGGNCERSNLEVVKTICDAVNATHPELAHDCHELILFVEDRPGHDQRYAIDATKITSELGWKPQHLFDTAIEDTVSWYLNNQAWTNRILSGEYRLQRLGTNPPSIAE
ncbi:dTDP-glucose 4,6-dehydratase [Rhodopirellula sp. MGV]|uniref:dTDP-glucose 4,6-dehydratase n=1 Tax=Rhodopirellula sp. MGV TaxID=2023130 RepID=UPI000B95E877|nr:dTDP-glucose 4,6-dehydratase [Rhodopirellula sp. MGV]OYP33025.1 dTDP-glucose 4,6-dehydratase [Rhodopirellula sp. MGV]PNY35312.1 dTDP-glucose 4,6-dehydratase [Rhodopirellula baltica]